MRITWSGVYLSIALLLVGLGRWAWVSRHSSDDVDAFSIVAVIWGAMGTLTSLWLVRLYGKAARRAADILSGDDQIARWTCSEPEWASYVQAIALGARGRARMLGYVFGGSGLLCASFVLIPALSSKPPQPLGATLSSVGFIIGFLAFMFICFWLLMVDLPIRRIRHPQCRDVYVGLGGMIVGGRFSWQIMSASLRAIRYEPGDPGTLAFGWKPVHDGPRRSFPHAGGRAGAETERRRRTACRQRVPGKVRTLGLTKRPSRVPKQRQPANHGDEQSRCAGNADKVSSTRPRHPPLLQPRKRNLTIN